MDGRDFDFSSDYSDFGSGYFSATPAPAVFKERAMMPVTSMRLEAKRFIPFEFPTNDPNLDQHGFTKGETAQHVEYPEHCNIPTVIHVNPLKHMLAVQTVEVDGKSDLQITLVPMDDNL